MSFNTRWTKHIQDKEEKEKFKSYLRENRLILETLSQILEEDLRVCVSERKKRKAYYMPAWSEYQADCNATERTLQQIIELLTLE